MRNAALDYASNSWAVFPLRGKQPLTGRGFHDATTDVEQIRSWWDSWPQANIGAAVPPTLVVIDVDREAGGFRTLAKLRRLPKTLATRTGGGGLHLWFLHPGGPLRQGAGLLGPGIDTRIPGKGYVVLPPSIHPSGRAYEWADPEQSAVMLPDWIATRLRPVAQRKLTFRSDDAGSRLKGLCQTVAQAPRGQRNTILNWAAFRARGLPDPDRAAAALAAAARAAGLPDQEIQNTLRSGLGVTR